MRSVVRSGALAGILALAASGCASSDLPESFRLEKFRVLALLADKPEVAPGDTVTITPLLSDISGEGRAIAFSAEACLDPGVGLGASPTCEGSSTRQVLVESATVSGLAAPDYTALSTSTVSVPIPSSEIVFAGKTTEEQFNGVDYLVVFQFQLPDGTSTEAFRRVSVSTRATRNQNPIYDAAPFLANGGVPSTAPTEKTDFSASVTPVSAETYDEYRSDGSLVTKTEPLETSWYISSGDLTLRITDGTGATVFSPLETPATGQSLVVVGVTRDDRGGVTAFIHRF